MSTKEKDEDETVVDPYLWDRSGPPNAELERLEKLLAPLAHQEKELVDRARVIPLRRKPTIPRFTLIGVGVLAAAAVILMIVKSQLQSPTNKTLPPPTVASNDIPPGSSGSSGSSCLERTPGSWAFHTEGAPARCGHFAAATGWMVQDEVLETPADSKATLDVAELGAVTLEPNTKLRLLGADGQVQKLDLLHGTLHAKINAPPRLFVVKTPLADAVDLGCEYTLSTDAYGKGKLAVSYGAVSLERPNHAPTLVVQHTWCPIGEGGPGTPISDTASDTLRSAAEDLDRGGSAGSFDRVVAASTSADTLTLWHVMRRNNPDERGRAYDKLKTFVPAPKKAPRDAIVRGDKEAIAAYRDQLSSVWYGSK